MPRGRPKKTTPSPGITINGQFITWAYIMKIHQRLGGYWVFTADAFWRARHSTGSNGIYRYINAGLKPRSNRQPGYIFMPSRDRENGYGEKIMDWWKSLYKRKAAGATADEVDSVLQSLIAKIGLPV
jgi:hypothetical protein